LAIIGYARVSTTEQNLYRQMDALNEVICEKIFEEKISGKDTNRPELQKMLDYIREGDTVVVHSISRLARSNRDLHNLVHQISKKGCEIQFLKEGIDTSTANGKLVFGIFASIAEFEREIIRERQAEGIASAKARGVKLGRRVKELPDNFDTVVADWKSGKIQAVEAFKTLGISKTRFYSLVKD
jgi:DNA invertase Pin-like site-specific DNA recombinase